MLGALAGIVRYAVEHHPLAVVLGPALEIARLKLHHEAGGFGLAVIVVFGPGQRHRLVVKGLDETGLVHPVEGMHATQIRRGMNLGSQQGPEPLCFRRKVGNALVGAKEDTVPVEAFEGTLKGGLGLIRTPYADLHGHVPQKNRQRLDLVPVSETQIGGAYPLRAEPVAERLDGGRVFDINGRQSELKKGGHSYLAQIV